MRTYNNVVYCYFWKQDIYKNSAIKNVNHTIFKFQNYNHTKISTFENDNPTKISCFESDKPTIKYWILEITTLQNFGI